MRFGSLMPLHRTGNDVGGDGQACIAHVLPEIPMRPRRKALRAETPSISCPASFVYQRIRCGLLRYMSESAQRALRSSVSLAQAWRRALPGTEVYMSVEHLFPAAGQ